MTRQEANLKILEILTGVVKESPDLRLNQILISMNVTKEMGYQGYEQDSIDYYEEPMLTLERINKED